MKVRVVGWFAIVSSSLAVVIAALIILAGFIDGAELRSAGDCGTVGHPQTCRPELRYSLIGSAVLGVAVWGVASGVALLRGRPWARRSVLITQSMWAAAVAGMFLFLATSEGLNAVGAIVWSVLLVAFAAVVASAERLPRPSVGEAGLQVASHYTRDDFDTLARQIRVYTERNMDQVASFRLPTSHGDVFVHVTRQLPEGQSIEAFPLYEPGGA